MLELLKNRYLNDTASNIPPHLRSADWSWFVCAVQGFCVCLYYEEWDCHRIVSGADFYFFLLTGQAYGAGYAGGCGYACVYGNRGG